MKPAPLRSLLTQDYLISSILHYLVLCKHNFSNELNVKNKIVLDILEAILNSQWVGSASYPGELLLEFCLFRFHTLFLSPLIGSCSSHSLPDCGVTYGSVNGIGPIFFLNIPLWHCKIIFIKGRLFFLDRQLLKDLLFVRVNLEAQWGKEQPSPWLHGQTSYIFNDLCHLKLSKYLLMFTLFCHGLIFLFRVSKCWIRSFSLIFGLESIKHHCYKCLSWFLSQSIVLWALFLWPPNFTLSYCRNQSEHQSAMLLTTYSGHSVTVRWNNEKAWPSHVRDGASSSGKFLCEKSPLLSYL